MQNSSFFLKKAGFFFDEHDQNYTRYVQYRNNSKSHERYSLAGSMKLPQSGF